MSGAVLLVCLTRLCLTRLGIADRNAILLLDFIHHVRARGASLKEALIESGAVRFRPILLTAGAAMLGAWPITLDPVFSGLAWALIFGLPEPDFYHKKSLVPPLPHLQEFEHHPRLQEHGQRPMSCGADRRTPRQEPAWVQRNGRRKWLWIPLG